MCNETFFSPWVVYSVLVEKCSFHGTIKVIICPAFIVCPLLHLEILLELKEKAFLQFLRLKEEAFLQMLRCPVIWWEH